MTQITLEDEFGCNIAKTISENNYAKILEIGSWDGTGSTQCIIAGLELVKSDKKILQCIEINAEKYNMLLKNVTQKYVNLYNMSSIDKKTFLPRSFDEIWSSKHNNLGRFGRHIVESWYNEDIKQLPDIGFLSTDHVLPNYDVVLIDGGEFSGYSEYTLLKDKTNCFILDDVFLAYKCNQIYCELAENCGWKLLYSNTTLRNGYAIFKRIL